MADIRVLMVTDGLRFNFGPPQPVNDLDASYFSLSTLVQALSSSTTPTISVYTAHRRRADIIAIYPTIAPYIDYPEDFLFTGTVANPVDLSQYDVIWMIADEGINGGPPPAPSDKKLTQAELLAVAAFMQAGGGVFAVGDHDGIGSYMCRRLPRIRTMRKWSFTGDTDPDAGPDVTGQTFYGNWSASGSAVNPPQDRFDTLRPDAADGLYYFNDQSDQTPQPVVTQSGAPIATANVIHTILRAAAGAVIANFPDHMHEGEATDFTNVMGPAPAFNPNQSGTSTPTKYALPDGTLTQYDEFPNVGGYQPVPEVIAWGQDLGHASLQPGVGATNPKIRGIVSVYDGRAVGVGRIVTGSTFHHYLDKNLIGDPMTSNPPGSPNGPTGTNTGFQSLPAILDPIKAFYVNVTTWLMPPNPNFYFSTNKSVFGLDEVNSAIAQHSTFPNAFYVVFDGIPASVVGSNPAIVLSGPFAQGLGYNVGSPMTAGNRVLVPFEITSIPANFFPGAGATTPNLMPLIASGTVGGTFYSAETLMELVGGADPYFTNVDPSAGNAFWLSQDLRVFKASPGSGAPFTPFPANQPYTYIANVLGTLNSDPGYTTGGADPFSVLALGNDLQEATSVDTTNAYFALARVRLRPGGSTPPSVRAFFRLWATQSNDTDYAPDTTYLSTYDAASYPATPLPGVANTTYPMFATAGGSGDYPGANTQSLTIPATGESHAYFGCYLDFSAVSPPLPSTHHCLVAQIADDGAPIINSNGITLSPENSDKLAQRNLQFTSSGNPGGPAAHRVPQTFDTRPSVRQPARLSTLLGYPDELMVDWGDTPLGTLASIYWPDVDALDIVRLANLLYSTNSLVAVDAHTVQCTVTTRVTFVPIPFGASPKLAGLFTIDLPKGVRKGQEFHVVVRRISTRRAPVLEAVRLSKRAAKKPAATARDHRTTDWRYIVGTFQVTIPVALEEVLLPGEENTLSIMKWRLQQTPVTNRWYPVLQRYVAYLSGRVNAFGGDACGIIPSPVGLPPRLPCGELVAHTGKVCEVLFDCFGDFEGFVLDTCCEPIRLSSRERSIGELALRACKERLLVTAFVEPEPRCRIRRVAVRCSS